MQATLVSMFGTVQQSRAAYRNEMQQYQLREGCGSGCAFRPQAAPAAGSFGHSRTAFNLNSNAGVTVRQTLFVRGSIVVETWTYNTGLLSSPMSKQLTSATTVRLQELDSVARAQQAG